MPGGWYNSAPTFRLFLYDHILGIPEGVSLFCVLTVFTVLYDCLTKTSVKTSVYKYPRTNKLGRTFYYKVPLWQTYVDQAEYAKFEKKIIKAIRGR